MKNKTFSFFTGVFFLVLLIFLVSYLLFLRNLNVNRAQMGFSEITSAYDGLTEENNPQPFFIFLESRHPDLLGFLVLENDLPKVFWGNEGLISEERDLVGLTAPEVSQELFVRQTDPGISTSAVFRVLGSRDFFLVSRAGLVAIVLFFVLSLLYYWVSNRKPSPQPTPSPVLEPPPLTEPVKVSLQPIEGPKSLSMVYPLEALEERLSGELHRAGSNQMDVSLGLISSDLGDENEFQSLLREHFIYKDVLFRENSHSCWVILPQMDLDLAIAEVERFMSLVRRRFATGGDGRNPRKPPVFTCGISSRNGRIMGGARLTKEARQAHRKAGPDALVIGFRTNSEQYRKFILRKQS